MQTLPKTYTPEDSVALTEKVQGFRNAIVGLQEELIKLPQVNMPANHHFIKGAYARELFIPAGTVIIGKIHKLECFNIVMQGRLTIVTENGRAEIQAPTVFVSQPMIKKTAYVHEDTIFINVFVTDETDIEKLESDLVYPDYPAEVL